MSATLPTAVGRATIEDLERTPEKAELINGRIVRFMATGYRPNLVAGRIFRKLADYVDTSGRGHALTDNIAFVVGRRPPTRRYTYGFRRAEDLAGIFVVLVMLASAALAAWESYRKLIDHPHADINNVGGRNGGTITAGLFLSEMVDPKVKWAHCDIAGPAIQTSGWRYYTKGMTGFATRTLARLAHKL